jgi:hypothetical protein
MATIFSKNMKKPPFCHKNSDARETPISKKTEKNAKKRQNTGKTTIYKNPEMRKVTKSVKNANFFI